MEKRILVSVDGSERGFDTVSILARLLKDQKELEFVLFHCVQQLAALAPGELAVSVEESTRLPFIGQEKVGNAILNECHRRLLQEGFPEERIQMKLKVDSIDPGQDIIKESEREDIKTIALGRRGRSQLENLMIGSVSGKVAQYAKHKTVWIVDTPLNETRKVLIAMEGVPDARTLTSYAVDFLAPTPGLQYTFLHLMPPVPPTFWDDGHILGPGEQKDRQSRIEKWRTEWTQRVEKFMAEARSALMAKGVPGDHLETHILPTKEGIARDLLNEIAEHHYQMVVMGKKSFHERKPFLLGSHAHKLLQNLKSAILCMIDT